jgi:hypothetical protein
MGMMFFLAILGKRLWSIHILFGLVGLIAGYALANSQAGPDDLKPGEFRWHPERSPRGPVVIIVSISTQRAYVFRNGIEIALSTVSTGEPGHRTPRGVFTILQKEVKHISTLYDKPMPYTERLTWGGIALHAGNLPGYPASHGCVHLPLKFAKLLYGITEVGTTVIIADSHSEPRNVNHPGLLVPYVKGVRIAEGAPPHLPPGMYTWDPESAPAGPVTILISGADHMVYVYRNGIPIGSAGMTIIDPNPPLDSAVYTLLEGQGEGPNEWYPGRPTLRWMAVDVEFGASAPDGIDLFERVRFPKQFAELLYDILAPGTTLYVTDQPATAETTTDTNFTVMTN